MAIMAAAIDAAGRQPAHSSAATRVIRLPDGASERNPIAFWEAATACVQGVSARIGTNATAFLGTCAQGDGSRPVVAEGKHKRPGGQLTTPPSRSCLQTRRSTNKLDGGSRDLLLHSALPPDFCASLHGHVGMRQAEQTDLGPCCFGLAQGGGTVIRFRCQTSFSTV